jgi:hypothetical protein
VQEHPPHGQRKTRQNELSFIIHIASGDSSLAMADLLKCARLPLARWFISYLRSLSHYQSIFLLSQEEKAA